MKFVLKVILVLKLSFLFSTEYFVAISYGNDENNGTSLATPFKTIEKAATVIEKTLRSAVSNLMQQNEELKLDPDVLKIKEAFVNGGPVMKRFRAASMGRASRLRRPTSHLTIVVSDDK